ncbi:MAG: radical SAM protein [Myxococcales bacterium]|nr:radical SAM protein [Myxococcales bacterium]
MGQCRAGARLPEVSDRLDRVRSLSVSDHRRDLAGMRYVYPVVSRRAGGVSIGVNLNPNNACNWRCVYCQVPELVAGKGPAIELELFASELGEMLDAVLNGDFLQRAPEGARRLTDIAFSGNGEPTTSPDFGPALEVVGRALERFGLRGKLKVLLITNGSMLEKPEVRAAVARLAELGGELWFKLDSATAEGARRINSCHATPAEHLHKLRTAAESCPTWLQTCWFRWHGAAPTEAEQTAYLAALADLAREGVPIAGIHLYTLARPSLQPEAAELAPLEPEWLEAFAERTRALGFVTKVSC